MLLIHRKKKQLYIPNREEGPTASGLVSFAQYYLTQDTRYVFGAVGDRWSKRLLSRKAALFTGYYTEAVINRYRESRCHRNTYCFDCSGLIKAYYLSFIDSNEAKYYNYNSKMLIDNSINKGLIESLPEYPGVCLYMSEGHVGIYIGAGKVIECTENVRFGNGVVETNLSDRNWEQWFYCPKIRYE